MVFAINLQKNNNFDFIRNKKYVIEQLMQENNNYDTGR